MVPWSGPHSTLIMFEKGYFKVEGLSSWGKEIFFKEYMLNIFFVCFLLLWVCYWYTVLHLKMVLIYKICRGLWIKLLTANKTLDFDLIHSDFCRSQSRSKSPSRSVSVFSLSHNVPSSFFPWSWFNSGFCSLLLGASKAKARGEVSVGAGAYLGLVHPLWGIPLD